MHYSGRKSRFVCAEINVSLLWEADEKLAEEFWVSVSSDWCVKWVEKIPNVSTLCYSLTLFQTDASSAPLRLIKETKILFISSIVVCYSRESETPLQKLISRCRPVPPGSPFARSSGGCGGLTERQIKGGLARVSESDVASSRLWSVLVCLCVRAQQQPDSLFGSPGLARLSRESGCSKMTSSEIFQNKKKLWSLLLFSSRGALH